MSNKIVMIITFFLVFASCLEHSSSAPRLSIPSVQEYFPNLTNDLTNLTWAHAVNNQRLLSTSITDKTIMMLEADVSLGKLIGGSDELIPIMAHPPSAESDLSLEQFLQAVINAQGQYKKGIKLDFKTTEVFQESWAVIDNYSAKFVFPVWLNADILPGPINSTSTPVDKDVFLAMSVSKLPTTTLSLGWTTRYGPLIHDGQYTTEQLESMKQAVVRHNVQQPITFAVRAGIVASSKTGMIDLISSIDEFQQSNTTTITIWMSSQTDPVKVAQLRDVILTVTKKRVFLDVPQSLRDELGLKSNTGSAVFAAQSVLVAFLTSVSAAITRMFQLF